MKQSVHAFLLRALLRKLFFDGTSRTHQLDRLVNAICSFRCFNRHNIRLKRNCLSFATVCITAKPTGTHTTLQYFVPAFPESSPCECEILQIFSGWMDQNGTTSLYVSFEPLLLVYHFLLCGVCGPKTGISRSLYIKVAIGLSSIPVTYFRKPCRTLLPGLNGTCVVCIVIHEMLPIMYHPKSCYKFSLLPRQRNDMIWSSVFKMKKQYK